MPQGNENKKSDKKQQGVYPATFNSLTKEEVRKLMSSPNWNTPIKIQIEE